MSNEIKTTAVSQLIERFEKRKETAKSLVEMVFITAVLAELDSMKPIERQNIVETYYAGGDRKFLTGEMYFNETFNNKINEKKS